MFTYLTGNQLNLDYPGGNLEAMLKFKNSNFVLTPVKSKLNFPTLVEFLMLRKTRCNLIFWKVTPVEFENPPGY